MHLDFNVEALELLPKTQKVPFGITRRSTLKTTIDVASFDASESEYI